MGTTIRIADNLNIDAITGEGIEYWTEITREQASAIATIVEAAGVAFVHNDPEYDVFVESFGLSLLSEEQIASIRAIVPAADAQALIDQILRHDIQLYITEALGLGAGRYMMSRTCSPARDVDMNLAGGNFTALWNELGFQPKTDDETCGELSLDTVEQALDAHASDFGAIGKYGPRLREVIAYGRQVGAAQLYWA
jgi:hypothetical protein